MHLPDIRTVADLRGVRILLRAPLNVPLIEGKVVNDFRLSRALETVVYLRSQGAVVIIIGHIGRDKDVTLRPVHEYLAAKIPIAFVEGVEDLPPKEAAIPEGSLFMLENLRRYEEETSNDSVFATKLAACADIFVQDAFSDIHREHASIVGVPQLLPSYAGLLLCDEVAHLSEAFAPQHPALFILGGAKFETKLPLIRKFLDTYDHVFVGGALAHDLFKMKGWSVGASLVSESPVAADDIVNHPHLLLPQDVVVERPDGVSEVKSPEHVGADEMILDAGPKTTSQLLELAAGAAFVLWNGPLGNYERGYSKETENLARGLAEVQAACIVGGGDTVASISALNLSERFKFVSTGGGAMLEFLQKGTLPGIEALTRTPYRSVQH